MKQLFLPVTKTITSLLLLCAVIGSSSVTASAQTTLSAGDIAIIGYNSDDQSTNDNFAFILLRDIAAGTTINFTDFGWCSGVDITGFQSGNACGAGTGALSDGAITWTSLSALSSGTQVVVWCKNSLSASTGTVTGLKATTSVATEYMNLAVGGDQIFAFQGTLASPTLITGINMNGNWDATLGSCTLSPGSSTLPAALGSSYAIAITPEVDNAVYNCSVISGTPTAIRAAIFNLSNWTVNDVTPFPLPLPATFTPATPPATAVEYFEDETDGSKTFSNAGKTFDITSKFHITYYAGMGYGPSHQFIDNFNNCMTAAGVIGSIRPKTSGFIKVSSLWLFSSVNCATVSNNGSAIIRGKKTGSTVYTITLNSADLNNVQAVDNGFKLINFSNYSAADTKEIDELEFEVGGSLRYLAIDNLSYIYIDLQQASAVTFANTSATTTDINWNNGTGIARAVFVKAGNSGTPAPVDNTTYTANTTFGSGTQIGSSGWYCVYKGTGSSVTVTGLSANTTYRAMVVEYNGATGVEKYLATTATNNPDNTTTGGSCTLTATAAAQTNITCNGGANGSATVNASGGTGPYTYSWAPSGGSLATASGLTAGTYTVTVTDASACIATQSFTITQPPALIASAAAQTNIACNGGANGSATVSASGGTGPYTYSWSPSGGTAATATGLAAGTYTVTVTDANTCTAVKSFTITQPPAMTISNIGSNSPVCAGSTIVLSATASGGTGQLSYNWSGPDGFASTQQNPSVSNASAAATGAYTLTVTDANNCSKSSSISVSLGQGPALTTISDQLLCNNTASAAITFSSNVGGATYSWTNDNTSIGLAASGTGGIPSFTAINNSTKNDTATIMVTPSADGCTGAPYMFRIIVNATPTVNSVANQNSCDDGTVAAISFSGDVSGTTFNWVNNDPSIGLAASGTGDIASFTAINNTSTPVTATITVTPSAQASGSSSGGGSAIIPELIYYKFNGTGTSVPNLASNPPAGTATATIMGGLSQGAGICDGALIGSGASSSTDYVNTNWTTNLTGTSWTVSFKSSNITSSSTLFYIFGDANAGSFRCFTNGVAGPDNWILRGPLTDVLISGGATVAPHTNTFVYDRTDGKIYAYLDGVLVNTVNQSEISIASSGQFKIGYSSNVALPSGGMLDEFAIFSRALTASEVEALAVGCNNTTTANCEGNPKTFTITVNPTPTVTATPASQTICSGSAMTTMELTSAVSGASFNWTRDNTTAVTGIAASGTGDISGTLVNTTSSPVTVTFTITPTANGCEGTPVTATVIVNPEPSVNTVSNQTICNNGATTSVSFSGAVSSTTYSWTNNNTSIGLAANGTGNIASFTATNTGATPETATITVTPSANGCTGASKTFTITVNPTPTVNNISNQTICNSGATTAVSFSGAVSSTTYSWTNNNTSIGLAANGTGNIASFTAINTGATPVTATITVTPSANGCTGASKTFTITVNPTPTVNNSSNQTICNSGATTAISFSGAVSSTTYSWANNNTSIGLAANGTGNIASFTATNTGATPVTATITVTPSANGCSGASKTFTITVNPTPTVNNSSNQTICNSGATTAISFSGAVSGTAYSWTNNNTSIGLTAGGAGDIASFTATNTGATPVTATITVTPSANGCTGASKTFTITVNPTPTVNNSSNQTICNSSVTTAINFSGAVSSTTYSWANNNTSIGLAANGTGNIASFTATNTGATPETATITVIPSANGCSGPSKIFTITVNPTPTVNHSSTQIVCNNETTTVVLFSGAVNGTSYTWTNDMPSIGLAANGAGDIAPFNAVNNGIAPVTATITVTPSANGCTGTARTFKITVKPTPTVHPVNSQVICNNGATETIHFNGDVSGTVYSWTNNNTSIGLDANRTSSNISSFTAINNGSTPAVATLTVTPLANGCTGASKMFTITVNPTPTINNISNQIICNNGSTTAISFSGGVSGTTYSWTNNNTSIGLAANGTGNIASFMTTNSGSSPATATITVTPSANGCTGTPKTFTITVNPAPTVNNVNNQTICNNGATTAISFSGTVSGTTYSWTNNNTSIGLMANGMGTITAFDAVNNSQSPATATLTITPAANGCTGESTTFSIIVNPTPLVSITATPLTSVTPGQVTSITATVSQPGGSYNWYFNNQLMNESGDKLNNRTVDGIGKYKLVYTDLNGCTNTSDEAVIEGKQTDIVYIYPNPSNGRFRVRYYNAAGEKAMVNIHTLDGRKVYTSNFANNIPYSDMQVDLSGVKAGDIYIVEVINGSGKRISSQKIIIQR